MYAMKEHLEDTNYKPSSYWQHLAQISYHKNICAFKRNGQCHRASDSDQFFQRQQHKESLQNFLQIILQPFSG